MSEAETDYTRRMNAATLQGRSLEEMEESRARKTAKEVDKRIQVGTINRRAGHDLYADGLLV